MSYGEPQKLRRSTTDRRLAGVCGGLGKFFGIDPVWFRLAFVLTALPGGVPGIPLYVICWIVIPEEEV
ncbi:MAG: PspC domain-containing protein [Anaerolineales bacterium]|nr:PspC domain-containing protein [Anaerolineales bacterium]